MAEELSILYQDDHLVAINKPPGHLVHPADQPVEGDLVSMKLLRDQIGQRVFTIHRLDRPTSGVLLFGLDLECSKVVHRSFENREVEKVYHAVVQGCPETKSWRCEEPLRKDPEKPLKPAVTEFKLLSKIMLQGECLSLLQCVPLTGRFHQIRRHLLSVGHPIVGDYRYAGIERSDFLSTLVGVPGRMLLQASKLAFVHPVTRKKMVIEAPVQDVPRLQSLWSG